MRTTRMESDFWKGPRESDMTDLRSICFCYTHTTPQHKNKSLIIKVFIIVIKLHFFPCLLEEDSIVVVTHTTAILVASRQAILLIQLCLLGFALS